MRKKEEPYKNVIIAGGGKIGSRLAKIIENNQNSFIIPINSKTYHLLYLKWEDLNYSWLDFQHDLRLATN